MAVSRRGMRKLSVDGTDYLWKVCSDEDWLDPNLAVIVVYARGGARLRVDFGASKPHRSQSTVGLPDGTKYTRIVPYAIATPARVAKAIRQARARGWDPEKVGGVFTEVLEPEG